nr:hypothetical protein [Angustibacter aerolatus]
MSTPSAPLAPEVPAPQGLSGALVPVTGTTALAPRASIGRRSIRGTDGEPARLRAWSSSPVPAWSPPPRTSATGRRPPWSRRRSATSGCTASGTGATSS